ncbi:MAG: T9SS type A sorting domain-containing protein, partial [Bacteroidota bacterium]|nr:T9SS type A sorting domain-containing protein [Bacteroidota bacterium]
TYDYQNHIQYDETNEYASYDLGDNGWQSIDITTLVNAWLDGSVENNGVVLIARAGDKFRKFYSKDITGSNADKHPFITVSEENNKATTDITLQGYNVYRNNQLLSEITNTEITTYSDINLAPYDYSYYVTAIYDEGESLACDAVNVTIEGTPSITVNPLSLNVTLLEGETTTQLVTIKNTGESSLNYQININEGNKPLRSAGDLISSFDAPDDMLVYAAGFDGDNLWLSDVMYNNNDKLYEVSTTGELISNISIPWSASWTADIVATDDYLYSVVVDPAGDNGINKIDKANGNLISSITGEFSNDGSVVSQALAYNSDNDEFWIGGWYHENIFHVDSQGNTISTIKTTGKPFHDITGLAWHPLGNNGNGSLFVVARDPYMIYELNPVDGSIIQSFPTYNNINMNGLSLGEDGSLWTASMGESKVYNIESGVNLIQNPSWLSILSNTSGEVSSGEEIDFEVYFDATDLDESTYLANISIISNDPNNSEVLIPTTLIVDDNTNVMSLMDDQDVYAYPNPFETSFTLSLGNSSIDNVTILNSVGSICFMETSINENYLSINLAGKAKGIYFVKIQSGNNIILKKIIKN